MGNNLETKYGMSYGLGESTLKQKPWYELRTWESNLETENMVRVKDLGNQRMAYKDVVSS